MTRSTFLKTAIAAAAGIAEVNGEVEMDKSNDYVLIVHRPISQAKAEELRKSIDGHFPGYKITILCGVTLAAMSDLPGLKAEDLRSIIREEIALAETREALSEFQLYQGVNA